MTRLSKKLTLVLTLFSVSVFFTRCRKDDPTNMLFNQRVLKGNLHFRSFYVDGSMPQPLRQVKVFLGLDNGIRGDSTNYFASEISDKNGDFAFYIPDTSVAYKLFSMFQDSSSDVFISPYYSEVAVEKPVDVSKQYNLIANIDTVHNNFLSVLTVDINHSSIPRSEVFVYTSLETARADSGFSGMGSFRRLHSDSLGKALLVNVPPGDVFVKSLLAFNDSTKFMSEILTETVLPKTINRLTIVLK